MAAPGSHTFFHKPPVNPNLATLLHCTQISAINFPHCAVARLSAASPPPPPAPLPPSAPRPPPSRPSTLYSVSLFSTHSPACDRGPALHLSPTHPIASSQSLPDRAVRIVIGKQISMAVLKVSALMEPAIFGPTKIPRREEEKVGVGRRAFRERSRTFPPTQV